MATCTGDEQLVLTRLAQSTDVNEKCYKGCIALHLRADLGDALMKFCLKKDHPPMPTTNHTTYPHIQLSCLKSTDALRRSRCCCDSEPSATKTTLVNATHDWQVDEAGRHRAFPDGAHRRHACRRR